MCGKKGICFVENGILPLVPPVGRGLAPAVGAPRSGGGPQGSAASGGVKRPQRLGRHLPLHKRSAGQRLSANPDCIKFAILPKDLYWNVQWTMKVFSFGK